MKEVALAGEAAAEAAVLEQPPRPGGSKNLLVVSREFGSLSCKDYKGIWDCSTLQSSLPL